MADEERIDEAIDRLQRVIALIGEQQAFTERRISALSRFALFDLFVVVLSISVLVIILSIQAPELRHAVANMNRQFGTIADDMYSVRRSMSQMTEDVASLPGIIGQVDSIQSNVGHMSGNIGNMNERVATMNANLALMNQQIQDMTLSFAVMDDTVVRMMHDVNHMSKPMRFFNQMNLFR
jgi:methyl-accepting chemotaxis protein